MSSPSGEHRPLLPPRAMRAPCPSPPWRHAPWAPCASAEPAARQVQPAPAGRLPQRCGASCARPCRTHRPCACRTHRPSPLQQGHELYMDGPPLPVAVLPGEGPAPPLLRDLLLFWRGGELRGLRVDAACCAAPCLLPFHPALPPACPGHPPPLLPTPRRCPDMPGLLPHPHSRLRRCPSVCPWAPSCCVAASTRRCSALRASPPCWASPPLPPTPSSSPMPVRARRPAPASCCRQPASLRAARCVQHRLCVRRLCPPPAGLGSPGRAPCVPLPCEQRCR